MNTLFIGIAGGTGSGKTTLTEHLAKRFGPDISVVHHDNYFFRTQTCATCWISRFSSRRTRMCASCAAPCAMWRSAAVPCSRL